jgi:KDO2-lipid IV(A) lauroyltransferase
MSARAGTSVAATAGADVRGTAAQRIRAALVAFVTWFLCRLPAGLAFGLADVAGNIWYRVAPARAATGRRNLARVTSYLAAHNMADERVRRAAGDPRALERLLRSAFRHAARYYVEVARTPTMGPQTVRQQLLIETPDVVDRAFSSERPVIFVGLHFGAIELPALLLAQRSGRAATVPMETIDDPELQRYFVRSRGRVGLRIVGLKEAARELLAALRRGESVGLVGDRDITGGGHLVPFFGAPAPLPLGPARLAIETGAPIYVAAVRRAGTGQYRGKLVELAAIAAGTRRERLNSMLEALATTFESIVADAPDQWWSIFFPIWPDLESASERSR